MSTPEERENHLRDLEAQKHLRELAANVCALAKMGLRLDIRYHRHPKKRNKVGMTITCRPIDSKIKTKKS